MKQICYCHSDWRLKSQQQSSDLTQLLIYCGNWNLECCWRTGIELNHGNWNLCVLEPQKARTTCIWSLKTTVGPEIKTAIPGIPIWGLKNTSFWCQQSLCLDFKSSIKMWCHPWFFSPLWKMKKKANLITSHSLEWTNTDIDQTHNWNVLGWHVNVLFVLIGLTVHEHR